MTDIKFILVKDPCTEEYWDYKYSANGVVMAGNLYSKTKVDAFFKTLHMFLLSIGPQNSTVFFGQDDEDLMIIFDDFINESAKFSREQTDRSAREFQSKFVNSLFKISRH
jgi:hypothetical protein